MEFPKEFILTPYNLFAWKEKMIMHLRGRGLYRLTMNTKTEPTSSIEKSKYLNEWMKHLELFAVSFLLNSSFTYPPIKPPMKPGTPWKGFLENRMR
jgi:hypothetical protein